ncbi:MAG: hypothetical protein PHQ12_00015 [Chthoniobacteraceae bacterium]|nr:hypothetical protein [Chthoniobacteraceae bacterium]
MKTVRISLGISLPILLAGTLATLLLGASVGNAQDDTAQAAAYRNGIAQDDLRNEAERVKQDLLALLEDFKESQATPQDLAAINAAVTKINDLSEKDMGAVVKMLKNASALDDKSALAPMLVNASKGQKSIENLLKAFSDNLSLQQAESSLAQRIGGLLLRQIVNLHQFQDNMAEAEAKSARAAKHASQSLLPTVEQNAIQTELEQILDTLQKVAATPDNKKKAVYAQALKEAEDHQLKEAAASAIHGLTSAKPEETVPAQRNVIGGLQAVLQKLSDGQSIQERLTAMAFRLTELAMDQRNLKSFTLSAGRAPGADLIENQRKLCDQVEALLFDLSGLNLDAFAQGKGAKKAMDEADADLRDAKAHPTQQIADLQENAAASLQAAAAILEKQREALANSAPLDPAKTLAQLKALADKIDDTAAKEKQIAANPGNPQNPSQQKSLENTTTQLQKDAVSSSPAAAASLGHAAGEMQNAQNQQQGQTSAQKAVEHLTDASNQVKQQITALTGATAIQQALQALIDQIMAAKAKTVEAAKSIQTAKGNFTEGVALTNQAQKMTQELKIAALKATQIVPDEAKKALAQAYDHLGQSTLEAAQVRKAQALSRNQDAQQDFDAAIQALKKAAENAIAAAMPQGANGGDQSGSQPGNQAGAQGGAQPGNQAGGNGPGAASASGGNGATGPGSGDQTGAAGGIGSQFIQGWGAEGGPAQVVEGIKPKDRDVLLLLQKAQVPPEYNVMLQQYSKNLANGESPDN